jgi:hypothetical protein
MSQSESDAIRPHHARTGIGRQNPGMRMLNSIKGKTGKLSLLVASNSGSGEMST